jgi:conjugal transfer pilin signal peptidase TrbI
MVWTAVGMIAVFHLAFGSFSKHFGIMVDTQENRCIPEYSVYFIKKNVKAIEKGKIYVFGALGLEPFFSDSTPIGKYAVGIQGDLVVQNEQGVFINNQIIAAGFPVADKLGGDETQFYKSYTIQPNQIFFTGTANRSFDSRYWGTASLEQVKGEAIPLW